MSKDKAVSKEKMICLTCAGLMAALCYVGYTVFPAISASGTKVHVGNAFVVLAALILGPWYGGAAGAVGLGLADILGGFAESAPRTVICKFLIGMIVGLVARRIKKSTSHSGVVLWTFVSTLARLLFNCVFEPALKYVWYTLLIGNAEKAEKAINALMAVTTYATLINTAINSAVAIALYLSLRPALIKTGIYASSSSHGGENTR